MALMLRSVPLAGGLRWLGDAFRLFRRRPMALSSMMLAFVGLISALFFLPWLLGVPLVLMTPPLMSLGVMVASQSALLDGPVHPGQFLDALRTDAARRRSLLLLSALYGVCLAGIFGLCVLAGGAQLQHLMDVMAGVEPGGGDPAKMAELMSQPDVRGAVWLFNLLFALLSVPFWHAPALVHWGAHGAGQALFSSTLALWRAKGAFALYSLGLGAAGMFAALAVSLVLALLGGGVLGLAATCAVMLGYWTVFYVSVLFSFNDSFGGAIAVPPAEEPQPPA